MRGKLFVALFFVAGLLQACATEYNRVTGKQEMIFISPQKETSMGISMSKQIEKEYTVLKDPQLEKRLYAITERLIKVQDRSDIVYHFEILDEDDINAFTVPGGYVYVFKGLLDFTENDDELAYVIGHEMGHNSAKHAVKKIQAALGAQLLLLASTQTNSPGFTRGMELAMASIFSEYSQQDEFQADELGIEYAERAGYDPAKAVDFLERLQNRKNKKLRPITYFKTHPHIPARIARIKSALGIPLDLSDFLNQ